jgi:hypothetical protein
MVVITVIGVAATMTSQVDLKVTGNTKVMRETFYVADGGIEMSPKVIARVVSDRQLPAFAETPSLLYDGVNYDNPASPGAYVADATQSVTLLDIVMGYEENDDGSNDTNDIQMKVDSRGSLGVDVDRLRTQYLSGGGTEFASGTEGVGVSAAANTAVFYNFESTGNMKSTQAQITAEYRKVAGVAGGR